MTAPSPGRHAFLSYVREDADVVDRLQRILVASGIAVWRDSSALWPGEDWRQKIRTAIADDSLAFIVCFSPASVTKAKSYQNEELLLAVEQIRLRPPGRPWLIPVRLGECDPPEYDLGAGRALSGLHRVDLFPDGLWDVGVARLVQTVQRVLDGTGRQPATPATAGPAGLPAPTASAARAGVTPRIKAMLRDPARAIELEDEVDAIAAEARKVLLDLERFPTQMPGGSRDDQLKYLIGRCEDYWQVVRPVAEALVAGCGWGLPEQEGTWTRTIQSVARTASGQLTGSSVLLDLRRFPVLPVLYAGAMAAVHRRRYGALRAIAVDAVVRNAHGETPPVVGEANVWLPFQHAEVVGHALPFVAEGLPAAEVAESIANGRRGKRFTPVPDALHAILRDPLRSVADDDQDYDELFERTEVLLCLLAADEKLVAHSNGEYRHGPWAGRFTWRGRHVRVPPEHALHADYLAAGARWEPLSGGLFGGRLERADAAFRQLLANAEDFRSGQH